MSHLNTTGGRTSAQSSLYDNAAAMFRQVIRDSIAACGYSLDAIAVAMAEAGCKGVDASVVSRMLSGERPWKAEHTVALPDDVEIEILVRQGARLGVIVVRPSVGQHAARDFVAGLMGLLMASPLPAKANAMAKASMPASAEKVVA